MKAINTSDKDNVGPEMVPSELGVKPVGATDGPDVWIVPSSPRFEIADCKFLKRRHEGAA